MITDAPAVLTRDWCNIYGDDINGAARYMGGLGDASKVDKQWFCPTRMVGRFVAVCTHGHRGQVMRLCGKHLNEFRKSIRFCPRCNQDENNGHRCNVKLEPAT